MPAEALPVPDKNLLVSYVDRVLIKFKTTTELETEVQRTFLIYISQKKKKKKPHKLCTRSKINGIKNESRNKRIRTQNLDPTIYPSNEF